MVVPSLLLLLLCTIVSCSSQSINFAEGETDLTTIDFFQDEDAQKSTSQKEPVCARLTCFMIAKGAAAVAWPFQTKGLFSANQQVSSRKLLEQYKGEQVCICVEDPDVVPADSSARQALLSREGEYLYTPEGELLYAPMNEQLNAPMSESMHAPMAEYLHVPMGEYWHTPVAEKSSGKVAFHAPSSEYAHSSNPVAEFKK